MDLQKNNTSMYHVGEYIEINDQLLQNVKKEKDDEYTENEGVEEGEEEEEYREKEMVFVKQEEDEDSNNGGSSLTEESPTPGRSVKELHPTPMERDEAIFYSSCSSHETDLGAENDDEEDEEETISPEVNKNRKSVKCFVCTYCDFKSSDQFNFETHIRNHMEVLFSGTSKGQLEGMSSEIDNSSITFKEGTSSGTFQKNEISRAKSSALGCSITLKGDASSETFRKNNILEVNSTLKDSETVQDNPLALECGEKYISCTHCDYKSSRADYMQSHMKKHGESSSENPKPKKLRPKKPSISLEDSGTVQDDPLALESDEKYISCTHCNYKSSRADHMQSHMKKHGEFSSKKHKPKRVRPKKPKIQQYFSCGYCDFKCIQTDTMKEHLKVIHAGKPSNSTSTKRTKPEKEPLTCMICGYRCLKISAMKIHNRIHTGERPYKCSHCDLTFTQKSHMIKHMKQHKGKISLSCKDCEFVCSDMLLMRQHSLQNHRLVKTLQCCRLCDYKCLTASLLERHMRTHSGEKPFGCTVCSYKCAQLSSLKCHFRKHTGEKPFSCTQCSYKSSQLSALNNHLKTHSDEKPYHCERCDFKCARAANLTRHMRLHVKQAMKQAMQS